MEQSTKRGVTNAIRCCVLGGAAENARGAVLPSIEDEVNVNAQAVGKLLLLLLN
jgi:hypothetical protein